MARTVVIVDDHAPFRLSARTLLELDGYNVIGEADGAASGEAAVNRLRPDVVLLDVALPDGSGFDVAKRLAGSFTRVVLVSSRDMRDVGSRVQRSGAVGFIPKNELSGERLALLLEETR